MPKRVLIAGIYHETHTFLPGLTRLSDMRVQRGEELLAAEGDASTMAGMLEVARASGWEVLPVIGINGGAGVLVADEVVEAFWQAFSAAARRELPGGIDGIYLNL